MKNIVDIIRIQKFSTFFHTIFTAIVCSITLPFVLKIFFPLSVKKGNNRGFVQILPLILFIVFTGIMGVIYVRVQQANVAEIRSRAVSDCGVYPCTPTPKPPTPTPTLPACGTGLTCASRTSCLTGETSCRQSSTGAALCCKNPTPTSTPTPTPQDKCTVSSVTYRALITSCLTTPTCNSTTGVWTCPISTPTPTPTPTLTLPVCGTGLICTGRFSCLSGEISCRQPSTGATLCCRPPTTAAGAGTASSQELLITQKPATPITPTPFQFKDATLIQQEYLGAVGIKVGCGTSGTIAIGPSSEVYGCSSKGSWINLTDHGVGPEYLTPGSRPVWLEGSLTSQIATGKAQTVNEYNQTVEQYKALGLPIPTPVPAGKACSNGMGSGSVAIGPTVNGKSTWQCGNDGQWKQCDGCLLTSIPAYLQDIAAYKARYLQTGESTTFDQAYNQCKASSGDIATCEQYAVQAVSNVRIQNAYEQYQQVMDDCLANKGSDCLAKATSTLANKGLTADQISQIPQQYTVNAKIQERYTRNYQPTLNSYLNCTTNCTNLQQSAITACQSMGKTQADCEAMVNNAYEMQTQFEPAVDKYAKCTPETAPACVAQKQQAIDLCVKFGSKEASCTTQVENAYKFQNSYTPAVGQFVKCVDVVAGAGVCDKLRTIAINICVSMGSKDTDCVTQVDDAKQRQIAYQNSYLPAMDAYMNCVAEMQCSLSRQKAIDLCVSMGSDSTICAKQIDDTKLQQTTYKEQIISILTAYSNCRTSDTKCQTASRLDAINVCKQVGISADTCTQTVDQQIATIDNNNTPYQWLVSGNIQRACLEQGKSETDCSKTDVLLKVKDTLYAGLTPAQKKQYDLLVVQSEQKFALQPILPGSTVTQGQFQAYADAQKAYDECKNKGGGRGPRAACTSQQQALTQALAGVSEADKQKLTALYQNPWNTQQLESEYFARQKAYDDCTATWGTFLCGFKKSSLDEVTSHPLFVSNGTTIVADYQRLTSTIAPLQQLADAQTESDRTCSASTPMTKTACLQAAQRVKDLEAQVASLDRAYQNITGKDAIALTNSKNFSDLRNFAPTVPLSEQAAFLQLKKDYTNLYGAQQTSDLLVQMNAGTVTNVSQMEQSLTDLKKDPLVSTVMFFNNITSGATKRGNDLVMSGCYGENKSASDCLSGAVMQGAAPAAAVALVAGGIIAAPIIAGVGATAGALTTAGVSLAYLGTAYGTYNAVSTWQQTAEYCNEATVQRIGTSMCTKSAIDSAAQMGLLFAGAAAGQAQMASTLATAKNGTALINGAEQAVNATAKAVTNATTIRALNIASGVANTGYFGYKAYDACVNGVPIDEKGTLGKDPVSCGTNIGMAAVSALRLGAALFLPTTGQAALKANTYTDIGDFGVNGTQAVIACASGDSVSCGNALAGLALSGGGLASGIGHLRAEGGSTIAAYDAAEQDLRNLYADPANPQKGQYAAGVTDAQVKAAEQVFRSAIVVRGQEQGLLDLAMKPLAIPESERTLAQKNLLATQEKYRLTPTDQLGQELLSVKKAVDLEKTLVTAPKVPTDSAEYKAYEAALTAYEKVARVATAGDPEYIKALTELDQTRQVAVETGYTPQQVELTNALKTRQTEYQQALEKLVIAQDKLATVTDPVQKNAIQTEVAALRQQLSGIDQEVKVLTQARDEAGTTFGKIKNALGFGTTAERTPVASQPEIPKSQTEQRLSVTTPDQEKLGQAIRDSAISTVIEGDRVILKAADNAPAEVKTLVEKVNASPQTAADTIRAIQYEATRQEFAENRVRIETDSTGKAALVAQSDVSAEVHDMVTSLNRDLRTAETLISQNETRMAQDAENALAVQEGRAPKTVSVDFNIRGAEADAKNQIRIIADALFSSNADAFGKLYESITGSGKSSVIIPMIAELKAKYSGKDVFVILNKQADIDGIFRKFTPEMFREIGADVSQYTRDTDVRQPAFQDSRIILTTKDVIFDSIRTGADADAIMRKVRGAVLVADEAQLTLRLEVDYNVSDGNQKPIADTNTGKHLIDVFEDAYQKTETFRKQVADNPDLVIRRDGRGIISDPQIQEQVERVMVGDAVPQIEEIARANKLSFEQALDVYLTTDFDSAAARSKQLAVRERVSALNSITKVLADVPDTNFGINAEGRIVPHDDGVDTGRQFSNPLDALAYEQVGKDRLGRSGDANLKAVTVSDGSVTTNYAEFLKNFSEFYGFSGTPDQLKQQFARIYGVKVDVSSVNQTGFVFGDYDATTHTFSNAKHPISSVRVMSDSVTDLTITPPAKGRVTNVVIENPDISSKDVVAQLRSTNPDADIASLDPNGKYVINRADGTTEIFPSLEAQDVYLKANYYNANPPREFIRVFEYGTHTGTDTYHTYGDSFVHIMGENTTRTSGLQGIGRDRGTNGGYAQDTTVIVMKKGAAAGSMTHEDLLTMLTANENRAVQQIELDGIKRIVSNKVVEYIHTFEDADSGGIFGLSNKSKYQDMIDTWLARSELDYSVGRGETAGVDVLSDSFKRAQDYIRSLEGEIPAKGPVRDAYTKISGGGAQIISIRLADGVGKTELPSGIKPFNDASSLVELKASVEAVVGRGDIPATIARGVDRAETGYVAARTYAATAVSRASAIESALFSVDSLTNPKQVTRVMRQSFHQGLRAADAIIEEQTTLLAKLEADLAAAKTKEAQAPIKTAILRATSELAHARDAKARLDATIATLPPESIPGQIRQQVGDWWAGLTQPKPAQQQAPAAQVTTADRDQAVAAAKASDASPQTLVAGLAAAQINRQNFQTPLLNLVNWLPFTPAARGLQQAKQNEAVVQAAVIEDITSRVASTLKISVAQVRTANFTQVYQAILNYELATVQGKDTTELKSAAQAALHTYVETLPGDHTMIDYGKILADIEASVAPAVVAPQPAAQPQPVATTKETIVANAVAATKKLETSGPVAGDNLRLPLLAGLVALEKDPTLSDAATRIRMNTAYETDVAYRLAAAFGGSTTMAAVQAAPGGSAAITAIIDREVAIASHPEDSSDPKRQLAIDTVAALAPQVGVTLGTTAGLNTADTVLNKVSTTLIAAWRSQHPVSAATPQVSINTIQEYIRTIGANIAAWWQTVRTKPVAKTISDGLAAAWEKIKSIHIPGIKFAPFQKLTDDEMKAAMQARRWRTDGRWAIVNATPQDHTLWWLIRGVGWLSKFNPFTVWDVARIATTRGGWQMYWSKHPAVAPAAAAVPRGTPLTAEQAHTVKTSNLWRSGGLRSILNATPTRNAGWWWATRGGLFTQMGPLNPFLWYDAYRIAKAPNGWRQGWQLFTRRMPTAEEVPSVPTGIAATINALDAQKLSNDLVAKAKSENVDIARITDEAYKLVAAAAGIAITGPTDTTYLSLANDIKLAITHKAAEVANKARPNWPLPPAAPPTLPVPPAVVPPAPVPAVQQAPAAPVSEVSELVQLPASIKAEEDQLTELNRMYGEFDAQLQKLIAQASDAQITLAAIEQKQQDLQNSQQQLAAIQTQMKLLQKQQQELTAEKTRLETQLATVRQQANEIQGQIQNTTNLTRVTPEVQAVQAQRAMSTIVAALDRDVDAAIRAKAQALSGQAGMTEATIKSQMVQAVRTVVQNAQVQTTVLNQLSHTPEFQNDPEGGRTYAMDIAATISPEWFVARYMATSRIHVVTQLDTVNARNIVAVGDVHGDWNALVRLLSGQVTNENGQRVGKALVDSAGNWIGKPTDTDMLILTGDLFDRAPNGVNSAQTAERIMNLQKQAGNFPDGTPKVKILLGNHDVNALYAYWRMDKYIHEGQSKQSAAKLSAITGLRPSISVQDLQYLYNHPALASWLMNLDGMMVADGVLYMHSDIVGYLEYGRSVAAVNNRFKSIVQNKEGLDFLNALMGRLTKRRELSDPANVDKLLRTYGARFVVHGHSQNDTPTDKRVRNIDGGLSEKYAKQSGKGVNRGRFIEQTVPGKPTVSISIQVGIPSSGTKALIAHGLSAGLLNAYAGQSQANGQLQQNYNQAAQSYEKIRSDLEQIETNLALTADNLQQDREQQNQVQQTVASYGDITAQLAKAKSDAAAAAAQVREAQQTLEQAVAVRNAQQALSDYFNTLRTHGLSVGPLVVTGELVNNIHALSQKFGALVVEAVRQHDFPTQTTVDRIRQILLDSIPEAGFVRRVIDASKVVRKVQTTLDKVSKAIEDANIRAKDIPAVEALEASGDILLSDLAADLTTQELESIVQEAPPAPAEATTQVNNAAVIQYAKDHFQPYVFHDNDAVIQRIEQDRATAYPYLESVASIVSHFSISNDELDRVTEMAIGTNTYPDLEDKLTRFNVDYRSALHEVTTANEKVRLLLQLLYHTPVDYDRAVAEQTNTSTQFTGFGSETGFAGTEQFISTVIGKDLLTKSLISNIQYKPNTVYLDFHNNLVYAIPLSLYQEALREEPELGQYRFRAVSNPDWNTSPRFSRKFIPLPITVFDASLEILDNKPYLSNVPQQDRMKLYIYGSVAHEIAHDLYAYIMNGDDRAAWKTLVDKLPQPITEYAGQYQNTPTWYEESFTEAVRLKTTVPEYLTANFPQVDSFVNKTFPTSGWAGGQGKPVSPNPPAPPAAAAPVQPKTSGLISGGILPAQWFENLANATIYKWWPETRTRGTLPVLFDALRLRSGQVGQAVRNRLSVLRTDVSELVTLFYMRRLSQADQGEIRMFAISNNIPLSDSGLQRLLSDAGGRKFIHDLLLDARDNSWEPKLAIVLKLHGIMPKHMYSYTRDGMNDWLNGRAYYGPSKTEDLQQLYTILSENPEVMRALSTDAIQIVGMLQYLVQNRNTIPLPDYIDAFTRIRKTVLANGLHFRITYDLLGYPTEGKKPEELPTISQLQYIADRAPELTTLLKHIEQITLPAKVVGMQLQTPIHISTYETQSLLVQNLSYLTSERIRALDARLNELTGVLTLTYLPVDEHTPSGVEYGGNLLGAIAISTDINRAITNARNINTVIFKGILRQYYSNVQGVLRYVVDYENPNAALEQFEQKFNRITDEKLKNALLGTFDRKVARNMVANFMSLSDEEINLLNTFSATDKKRDVIYNWWLPARNFITALLQSQDKKSLIQQLVQLDSISAGDYDTILGYMASADNPNEMLANLVQLQNSISLSSLVRDNVTYKVSPVDIPALVHAFTLLDQKYQAYGIDQKTTLEINTVLLNSDDPIVNISALSSRFYVAADVVLSIQRKIQGDSRNLYNAYQDIQTLISNAEISANAQVLRIQEIHDLLSKAVRADLVPDIQTLSTLNRTQTRLFRDVLLEASYERQKGYIVDTSTPTFAAFLTAFFPVIQSATIDDIKANITTDLTLSQMVVARERLNVLLSVLDEARGRSEIPFHNRKNFIDTAISLAVRPEFSDDLAKDIVKTLVTAQISGSFYNERYILGSQLSKILQEPPNQDIQNIRLTHARLQYQINPTDQNRQDIADYFISIAKTKGFHSISGSDLGRWLTNDILEKASEDDAAFLKTMRGVPNIGFRLGLPDGYAFFMSSLANLHTPQEMIAKIIEEQTAKNNIENVIHWFTTIDDRYISFLPPDMAAFWTAYQTTPAIQWRLLESDGYTYFQQSLADKKTANEMIATVIQDETSKQHLSVIVRNKLIKSISDDVLTLLPPNQKIFWSSILEFLHAGVSESDILKLTGQVEKNPAIRAALQYIPPEQWVSFTKRYDLFASLFDIDSQVASIRALTGEQQQVQIANLRKKIQEINQSYKTFAQGLSMGNKPVSDEDFFYLNYYLNSIDGNYAQSFIDIKKHFGIEGAATPQQTLRAISNALTTVPLKPMVLTFPFLMQDVYYSVPDDIAETMRIRLAALPVVPAEQQQDLIAQLEKQYATLSDASLTMLISEQAASPIYQQIVDGIPQDGQEQFLKKFNRILGANLPLEQKIPALRAVIAAAMTVDDKQLAAVMQTLFTMAGLNDLLPEFSNNTLSRESMSLFSQQLQELVKTSLPEFITLHPGLADFQKTLESTDIWKQIKQANAKQNEADQTKQKYTKTISLVFSERTLLDVWQGLISGTCFGNYPYHLSKRVNIVPVKMVKDGEVFGNALFLIQPGKMILIGFDPSESFASVVSSDRMKQFVDRSMEAFVQIADANGWEFMIGVSSEVGGYSNRPGIADYISVRYLAGATEIPITPEKKLQPQYGYEPKNALTLAQPILDGLRSAGLKPVLLESIVKEPVINLADELNREAEHCEGQGKCTTLGRLVKTLGDRAFTSMVRQSWRTPIGELWRNFQSWRSSRQGQQQGNKQTQQPQMVGDTVSAFIAAQANAAGVTDQTQIQQIQTLITAIVPQVTSGKLTYDEVIAYLDGKSSADVQKTALLTQLFETGPPATLTTPQQTLLRHALQYLQSQISQTGQPPQTAQPVQQPQPQSQNQTGQQTQPIQPTALQNQTTGADVKISILNILKRFIKTQYDETNITPRSIPGRLLAGTTEYFLAGSGNDEVLVMRAKSTGAVTIRELIDKKNVDVNVVSSVLTKLEQQYGDGIRFTLETSNRLQNVLNRLGYVNVNDIWYSAQAALNLPNLDTTKRVEAILMYWQVLKLDWSIWITLDQQVKVFDEKGKVVHSYPLDALLENEARQYQLLEYDRIEQLGKLSYQLKRNGDNISHYLLIPPTSSKPIAVLNKNTGEIVPAKDLIDQLKNKKQSLSATINNLKRQNSGNTVKAVLSFFGHETSIGQTWTIALNKRRQQINIRAQNASKATGIRGFFAKTGFMAYQATSYAGAIGSSLVTNVVYDLNPVVWMFRQTVGRAWVASGARELAARLEEAFLKDPVTGKGVRTGPLSPQRAREAVMAGIGTGIKMSIAGVLSRIPVVGLTSRQWWSMWRSGNLIGSGVGSIKQFIQTFNNATTTKEKIGVVATSVISAPAFVWLENISPVISGVNPVLMADIGLLRLIGVTQQYQQVNNLVSTGALRQLEAVETGITVGFGVTSVQSVIQGVNNVVSTIQRAVSTPIQVTEPTTKEPIYKSPLVAGNNAIHANDKSLPEATIPQKSVPGTAVPESSANKEVPQVSTEKTLPPKESAPVATRENIDDHINDVRHVKYGNSGENLVFKSASGQDPYAQIPAWVYDKVFPHIDTACASISDCEMKLRALPLADQTASDLTLNKDFVPDNLVRISDYGIKGEKNVQITRSAAERLQGFVNEVKQVKGWSVYVMYGYRSYSEQEYLYQGGARSDYAAKPGMSMHQSGDAIDMYRWDGDKLSPMGGADVYAIAAKYGLVHPLDDPPHWLAVDAVTPGIVEAMQESDINFMRGQGTQGAILSVDLAIAQAYEYQIEAYRANPDITFIDTNSVQAPVSGKDSQSGNTDNNTSQKEAGGIVADNVPVTKDKYGIVYYSQRDPRWKSEPVSTVDSKTTIGGFGCGQSVTAMLLSSFTNEMVTPEDVVEHFYPPGIMGGTGFPLIRDVISRYGFTDEAFNGSKYTLPEKMKELQKNGDVMYVAIQTTYNGQPYTHNTIAVGVTPDGKVIYDDPFYGQQTTLEGFTYEIIGTRIIHPPRSIASSDTVLDRTRKVNEDASQNVNPTNGCSACSITAHQINQLIDEINSIENFNTTSILSFTTRLNAILGHITGNTVIRSGEDAAVTMAVVDKLIARDLEDDRLINRSVSIEMIQQTVTALNRFADALDQKNSTKQSEEGDKAIAELKNIVDQAIRYYSQVVAVNNSSTVPEFGNPLSSSPPAPGTVNLQTQSQSQNQTGQQTQQPQMVGDTASAFIAAQANAAGVTDPAQIQQVQTLVTAIVPQVTSGKLTYDEVIAYLDGKSPADVQKTALLTQLFETGPPATLTTPQQTLLRHALQYLPSQISQTGQPPQTAPLAQTTPRIPSDLATFRLTRDGLDIQGTGNLTVGETTFPVQLGGALPIFSKLTTISQKDGYITRVTVSDVNNTRIGYIDITFTRGDTSIENIVNQTGADLNKSIFVSADVQVNAYTEQGIGTALMEYSETLVGQLLSETRKYPDIYPPDTHMFRLILDGNSTGGFTSNYAASHGYQTLVSGMQYIKEIQPAQL